MWKQYWEEFRSLGQEKPFSHEEWKFIRWNRSDHGQCNARQREVAIRKNQIQTGKNFPFNPIKI